MQNIAKKWDWEIKEYKDYILPKGASIFEEDTDKEVSCASCGIRMLFGGTYTSNSIHDETGFGYGVCRECHSEEVEEREKAREKKQKPLFDMPKPKPEYNPDYE